MAEQTSLSSLCGVMKSNLETTRQLLSDFKSSMADSYREIDQCIEKSAQEMKQSCARILKLLQEEIDASESPEIVASESRDVDASELSADKMMAMMTDDSDSLQDARKSEAVSAIHRHYKPQIHPSLRPPAKPSYCSQHTTAVAGRRHSIQASIPKIIPRQSKVKVRLFSVYFAEGLGFMKFRNITKVTTNGVYYAQLNLSRGAQKLFDTLLLRNNAIWSHTIICSSISLGAIPIDMLCPIVLQENVVLVNHKQVYASVCSASAYVQVLSLEWFSKIDEEETTHQVVDDMPRMIMLCLKSLFLGYITVGIFTTLLMYGTKRPIVLAFFIHQLVNFLDIEKLLSDNSSRKIVGSYVIVTVMLGFWPMSSPPLPPKPPESYQTNFPSHLNGFYWYYHVNLNMELLSMLAIAGNGVKFLNCQFSSKMSMYFSYSVHQRRLTVLQSSIEYERKRAVWVPTQQTMVSRKVWTTCSWYGYHLGLLSKPTNQSTVMIIWISSTYVGCVHFMEVGDSFAALSNIVCQIMLPSSIKVHCHDIENHSITASYVQYVLVSLNFAINLTLSCTGFTIIFLASTWHARVDEFGWPVIWIEQQMMTATIMVQFLTLVQQAVFERFPGHLKMHMVSLEVGNSCYGLYHPLILGGVYILKSSFAIHDELAGVLIHGKMKLVKLLNLKLVSNIMHLFTHIATMTQSGCLPFSISDETQFFWYAPRDTQPSNTFDMFNSLLMEWLFHPSSTKDFVVAFDPISLAPILENNLSITMLKFIFYLQTFIVVVTIAAGAIKNSVNAAINWLSTFKNAPYIFQPIEGDIMVLIQQVAADQSKQFYYASHHVRIKQQIVLPINRENWDPGEAGYFVNTIGSLQLENMLNFSVRIGKMHLKSHLVTFTAVRSSLFKRWDPGILVPNAKPIKIILLNDLYELQAVPIALWCHFLVFPFQFGGLLFFTHVLLAAVVPTVPDLAEQTLLYYVLTNSSGSSNTISFGVFMQCSSFIMEGVFLVSPIQTVKTGAATPNGTCKEVKNLHNLEDKVDFKGEGIVMNLLSRLAQRRENQPKAHNKEEYWIYMKES